MTKNDKKLGKVSRKHVPDLEPSRLRPAHKDYPKKQPQYRVERYWGGWAFWTQIAKARTLDEAKHQAMKPARDIYLRFPGSKPINVRIIDNWSGEIVWQERLYAPQPSKANA